jgi:hypothetical protein
MIHDARNGLVGAERGREREGDRCCLCSRSSMAIPIIFLL